MNLYDFKDCIPDLEDQFIIHIKIIIVKRVLKKKMKLDQKYNIYLNFVWFMDKYKFEQEVVLNF